MYYRYENKTGDMGHPGRLNFTIMPYIGLAYYDGTNDGEYEDKATFSSVVNFNFVPTGTYPNLFDSTGNEIGNFIPALPFTLNGSGVPNYGGTVVLEIIAAHSHCHVQSAITNTLNPTTPAVYFNIATPPTPATFAEEQLLKDYGKVFYYYWQATHPITNAVVKSGFIMPRCNTNNSTYWDKTGVSVTVPGAPLALDLYYNIFTNGSPKPSYEIVLPYNTFPSETIFSQGGYTYKVELVTSNTGGIISTLSLRYL